MYSKFKSLSVLLLYFFLLISVLGFSQSKKILVYYKTNGFEHESIGPGITMFENLGKENGDWTTDNSLDSGVFNTLNMAQYDAVVFLNTSGNGLLIKSEQEALESFIASGKGFIGIHAATDTYRDKSWPFYNELVGGIIQIGPNHTSNIFNADMEVKTSNRITSFLGPIGSTWNKDEEYYYWELNGGQLSTDNIVLLEVASTGSNSYDAARPITWYKESITYDDDENSESPDVTLTGIKSFYTALGHNSSDYSGKTNFSTMLKNATLWAIGNATLSILQPSKVSNFKIVTNPVKDKVQIELNNLTEDFNIIVFNVLGKQLVNSTVKPNETSNNLYELNVAEYKNGLYFFVLTTNTRTESFKIIKI